MLPEDPTITAGTVDTEADSSSAAVETDATETVETEISTDTQTDTADEVQESTEQTDTEQKDQPESRDEDEELLGGFKESAAATLRNLARQNPKLAEALKENPKLNDFVHAVFRRDAALRDRNITIAEMHEYRDRLPGGLQDLKAIEQELSEVDALDSAFERKDAMGNYAGHPQILQNWYDRNPQAMVALLKSSPKTWARLDPESYNETFGEIIASTLAHDGVAERLVRIHDKAKSAGDAETQNEAAELWNYVTSFGKKHEKDTPERQALRRDREKLDSDTKAQHEADGNKFHQSFVSESKKLQLQIIQANSIFKKLPQAIPPAKKARMAEDVRNRIIAHLKNSRSFMNELTPKYNSWDLTAALDVQKKAWSKDWLVNLYVRKVLEEETPGIIQGNNSANAVKRSSAARTGIANRNPARPSTPTGKPKERTSPSDYTMEEIMSGKVPEHVMDAYIAKRGR